MENRDKIGFCLVFDGLRHLYNHNDPWPSLFTAYSKNQNTKPPQKFWFSLSHIVLLNTSLFTINCFAIILVLIVHWYNWFNAVSYLAQWKNSVHTYLGRSHLVFFACYYTMGLAKNIQKAWETYKGWSWIWNKHFYWIIFKSNMFLKWLGNFGMM